MTHGVHPDSPAGPERMADTLAAVVERDGREGHQGVMVPESVVPETVSGGVPSPPDAPLSVVDPGATDGEMIARMWEAGELPFPSVYAPGGSVNLGTVHGGQHLDNHNGVTANHATQLISYEGPIGADEVLAAQSGFVEPDGFASALEELRVSKLLFLSGRPGTGRRTTALNLLARATGSMAFRAVDGAEVMGNWRPEGEEIRGYLTDGLALAQPPQHWEIGRLRDRLRQADACLVVLVDDRPEVIHHLRRELHLSAVRHRPPRPSDVFDAQLRRTTPDADARARLLDDLPAGTLESLLTPDLTPIQSVELAAEVARGVTDLEALRERLSFLAEEEVPGLLRRLRGTPDSLSVLLSACVFEGQDARTVLREAERLRGLAGESLRWELPGTKESAAARENPGFVARRPLSELLREIGARQCPPESRTTSRYVYTVEPVRFTRRGRARAVLSHVWREYDELARLLTAWLEKLPDQPELPLPVGHVLGLSARWTGGRTALSSIESLARSTRATARMVAAHALGVAAEDPTLASQVRSRMNQWSTAGGWQVRTTVAYACGVEFGIARPDRALRLLGMLARSRPGRDEEQLSSLASTVRRAMGQLWIAGNEWDVLRTLDTWSRAEGPEAAVALDTIGGLMTGATRPGWEQLLSDPSDHGDLAVQLLGRALRDARVFDTTARNLLGWCRTVAWDQRKLDLVNQSLTALARGVDRGVFRLLVLVDRDDRIHPTTRHLAHERLEQWRAGDASTTPATREGDPA